MDFGFVCFCSLALPLEIVLLQVYIMFLYNNLILPNEVKCAFDNLKTFLAILEITTNTAFL